MIIFLNGSLNSGKTTVAHLLEKKIEKTAVVEIDELRNFIAWMPIEEAVPINLENALSVMRNFLKRDLNIIVSYPLSQKNYDYFMENLKELNEKIFVFTLSPRLEVILSKRGERKIDDWDIKRIKYHYEMGLHKPSFGVIIDNSKQTPEETVNIILDYIK